MKKLFGFVILFVLFVPLERLYPLKKDQKVFREGFKTDLVHFFVNEILVKIGMFFVALPLVLLMNKLAPGLKAFIASLPGIMQFFTAILILWGIFPTACTIRYHSCGNCTRCITVPVRWIGWLQSGFTH